MSGEGGKAPADAGQESERCRGMKRGAWLALLLLWPVPALAASTVYELAVEGALVRGTLDLGIALEKPSNIVDASVLLPEGAFVSRVEDEGGVIEDFSVDGGVLSFRTHYAEATKKRRARISLDIADAWDDAYAPARVLSLSLPAFPSSRTRLALRVPAMRAFEATHGFGARVEKDRLVLEGTGPLSVRVLVSEAGAPVGRFWVINKSQKPLGALVEGGLADANRLFSLVPAVLGAVAPLERYPVLVLEDTDYETLANAYSEGLYRSGGVILVRASLFEKNAAPVLLHETVHAVNAHILSFNQTEAAWLDEGVAKFVEYLARQALGLPSANLFSGPVRYKENGRWYELPPRGSMEELARYYEDGEDFMLSWTPDGPAERRAFGYAFSELFVRERVQALGLAGFRARYASLLDVNEETATPQALEAVAARVLGAPFAPCKRPSRAAMEACVEQANALLPALPARVSARVAGALESEKAFDGGAGVAQKQARAKRALEAFSLHAGQALQEIFLSLGRVLSWMWAEGAR